MFKINDVNKLKELNSSKAKKAVGGNFSSYLQQVDSNPQQAVSGSGTISVADAIFATQMVHDEEEREIKKKLIKRSNALLDKLDEIRDSLLFGAISKDKLIEISRFVKEKTFNSKDEKLQEIIQEIELRVEVELAKLTK